MRKSAYRWQSGDGAYYLHASFACKLSECPHHIMRRGRPSVLDAAAAPAEYINRINQMLWAGPPSSPTNHESYPVSSQRRQLLLKLRTLKFHHSVSKRSRLPAKWWVTSYIGLLLIFLFSRQKSSSLNQLRRVTTSDKRVKRVN